MCQTVLAWRGGVWVLLAAGRVWGTLPERGDALPPAAPPSPTAFLSDSSAPTPVTDIRTDRVEQKSVSLSWQEPGFPTANGTEYEVKYYEKVGAGAGSSSGSCPGYLPGQPSLPSGARCPVLLLPVAAGPRCVGRSGGEGGREPVSVYGAVVKVLLALERGALQMGAIKYFPLRHCYAICLRKF